MTKTKDRPPTRIFVIPASEADEAVVFCRGPSNWYHVIRWGLARDEIEHGAWFKGRICPEKCDLSPDGELLLYFVHQGRKLCTAYTDAWTAVSRSPWLTALGLWPQGTTYGGGGRFAGERHVVLRIMEAASHPDHPARGLIVEFGNLPGHESTAEVEGADWSGRDHRGQILFAMDGKLFRRLKNGEDHIVADLNDLVPDPQAAPDLAGRPIGTKKVRKK